MGITNIPMMNAEIVMGVSLMLLFIAFHMTLGFGTILIAHITFNIPYVILSVAPKLKQTNRYTYEAALDLGASPVRAFFKVVFPDIVPGVLSGFMLAFTMSLDDFVITHFTKGPGVDTLSTKIYSEVRKGIKPEMYALSTLMFVTVLILLILINLSPADKRKKNVPVRFGRARKIGRFFFQKLIPVAMAVLIVIGGFIYGQKDGTSKNGQVIVYNWGEYIDPEIIDLFEEETGIQVELTTDKKLEDVIGPSMQGGEYPDVIHLATGREAALTEQFIKGNMITDITDVLSMKVPGEDKLVSEKIAGGFTDTSLTNPYGDGKTYLAPMFYSPCGLFYNAGLLEEKGWDVPTTWDEMWELGDKAKEEGIYLFTYPTTGYFDAFFYALMYAAGGSEFFDKATNYEEGIWETPEAQTCFDIVAKLAEYTNPITPAQANDQDFTQNQQLVLDNKAIFMPNGTWIVGEMADAPRADGFKWGMTALPAVKAGGDSYSYTWFEQAWIPSGAEHQDAAKLFISYLYSDKACEIFAKAGAIQPVLGIADKLEGDNVMFYSIYDNGAKAAMGNFASFEAIPGIEVRTVFFDPVNSLVSGDMTEQEWIDGIISASDQMRANLK